MNGVLIFTPPWIAQPWVFLVWAGTRMGPAPRQPAFAALYRLATFSSGGAAAGWAGPKAWSGRRAPTKSVRREFSMLATRPNRPGPTKTGVGWTVMPKFEALPVETGGETAKAGKGGAGR